MPVSLPWAVKLCTANLARNRSVQVRFVLTHHPFKSKPKIWWQPPQLTTNHSHVTTQQCFFAALGQARHRGNTTKMPRITFGITESKSPSPSTLPCKSRQHIPLQSVTDITGRHMLDWVVIAPRYGQRLPNSKPTCTGMSLSRIKQLRPPSKAIEIPAELPLVH